jgi:hypothetical protein
MALPLCEPLAQGALVTLLFSTPSGLGIRRLGS